MEFYTKIFTIIEKQLQAKLNELDAMSEDLKTSLNEESKSTAGDKHNTSRAMIHLEQEKIGNQYHQIKNQIQQLKQMKEAGKKNNAIGFGKLVKTSNNYFLLGISLGKIKVDDKEVFCISMESPIGRQFRDKNSGDNIVFLQNEEKILEVLPG